ncbi:hypothetical protein GG344DRAFT_56615, partial [Lentinula edodes]
AKPSQTKAITDFLHTGYTLVPSEPLTREWFAVRYEDSNPPTYAIFDTFAAEEGQQAHLTGQIAKALMDNASSLLDVSPEIAQLDVLVSLVRPNKGSGEGTTAGVTKGLRVLFTAKPDKVDAVRDFLKVSRYNQSLCGLLKRLLYDIHFFKFHRVLFHLWKLSPRRHTGMLWNFPEQTRLVEFFPDNTGRGAHVAGKVAPALFGSADELLTGAPDVVKLDVHAAKV